MYYTVRRRKCKENRGRRDACRSWKVSIEPGAGATAAVVISIHCVLMTVKWRGFFLQFLSSGGGSGFGAIHALQND